MSFSTKYTRDEKKIAQHIYDLQSRIHQYRIKVLDYEAQISYFKGKLAGKYGKKVSPVPPSKKLLWKYQNISKNDNFPEF